MKDKVMLMKDWIETGLKMPEESRNKYIAQIVLYGFTGWVDPTGDVLVDIATDLVFPQIDRMSDTYEKMCENGKKGGRPKKARDDEIYGMRLEGKSASMIAKELNVDERTIYNNNGWKDAGKEIKQRQEKRREEVKNNIKGFDF